MNIDPKLIDVFFPEHDGYPDEERVQDTREAMMMAASDAGATITAFPESMWIEPSQWAEVAKYNDENKLWGIDYLDRFTNQNPTHECTCHSLSRMFESAWNRQRRIAVGPPVAGKRLEVSATASSVWVSPLSVYAEANPGQWGGAGCRQVLSIATSRGFLPETIQPKAYGFKHALHGTCGKGGVNQSRGEWVSVSRFPSGWEETAKRFRPLEFIFPESIEQTVCLLLHGLMIGVGRSGHAIPYGKYIPDQRLFPYPDSYDVIRYDSWSTARGCVGGSSAILSTTLPDDWNNPAGNVAA